MRTWMSLVVALVASGCIVPRSMVLGQMAAPVGRGATDVAVFTGVQYASQRNPQFDKQDPVTGDAYKTEERTSGFTAPNFEANLQYGFSDHVTLNVHGSSAGLQPGLKLTVNKSKTAHFALMPQVAFGYGSIGQSTGVSNVEGIVTDTSPRTQTSFTFLGGLKAFFSHKSGFYAGVGYDFMFNRNYSAAIVGATNVTDKAENVTSTLGHQISVNVGLDITLGIVHLRPEVAFAVYPGISQTTAGKFGAQDIPSVTASGGFGWAIFPGFTMAITSPKRQMTAEEEEEEADREREEKRKKAKANGEEEDDDEDDEGDNVRAPKGKKKARLDDDEDEDQPKKTRRRPVNDDED